MKLKGLLRFLRSGDYYQTDIFCHQRDSFIKAYQLVRLYYLLLFYFLASSIKLWQKSLTLDTNALSLLWPVLWIQEVDIATAMNIIMVGGLLSTLFAVLYPNVAILRFLSFIFFFEYVAFIYSFGKIGHSYHGALAVGFIFLFLPNKEYNQICQTIRERHMYLTVFLGAQVLVLLFYSLAGFWKVYYGVLQFLYGEIGSFSPYALSYQTAKSFLQKNSTTIFGHIILDYPMLGWPMYLSVIYLEFCSFLVAFRPALHKFWGVSIILFHLGSGLITGPLFANNILLISLILVCSPFSDNGTVKRDVIMKLPLLGFINQLLLNKEKVIK